MLPCDNCGEWVSDKEIVHTFGPETGKPIQLCPECAEEDNG
jgi:hypothetical protein